LLLPTPMTMRRLAIAKYMYAQGLEQERKGDPLAGLALLPLHDAVELFLQVAAEIHPAVTLPKSVEFMGYWAEFSKASLPLPYRQGMLRFNNARVEVKHRGTLPSLHDVEGLRSTVTAFLVETTPKLFQIEFDSISLSSLVRSDDVRSGLQAAETAALAGQFDEALEQAAKAFRLSLRHHRFGEPPKRLFDPTGVVSDLRWRHLGIGEGRLLDALEQIGEAITVLAYHLDYDGYRYLQTYGPTIHDVEGGGMNAVWTIDLTTDRSIVDRCVAFAVDAAPRLEGVLPDFFCRPHPRRNAGFFDFSHCRLFPLQYRLPARFDTIPSRPSSQALANTSAPSAAKASLNRMPATPATRGESAARRSSSGR
jgi:hypothetical protein